MMITGEWSQLIKRTWHGLSHLPFFALMRRAIRLKRLAPRPGRRLRKCYMRRIARRLAQERKRYRA
jgi:hypothetical protein